MPVALAVDAPLREGVGGLEGELLRAPDPDPLGEPVGVAECVEERDRVKVPLGVLDCEALPLPLLPPLSVGVAVEEEEGEEDVDGEASVGRWEALADTVGEEPKEGSTEGEGPRLPETVGVMVWVTEAAR